MEHSGKIINGFCRIIFLTKSSYLLAVFLKDTLTKATFCKRLHLRCFTFSEYSSDFRVFTVSSGHLRYNLSRHLGQANFQLNNSNHLFISHNLY